MTAAAALLALGLCALTHELHSSPPLEDLSTLSEDQLVSRVREQKNRVDWDRPAT